MSNLVWVMGHVGIYNNNVIVTHYNIQFFFNVVVIDYDFIIKTYAVVNDYGIGVFLKIIHLILQITLAIQITSNLSLHYNKFIQINQLASKLQPIHYTTNFDFKYIQVI